MSLILFFFFRISPLITFTITSPWDLILGHSANVETVVPPAQVQESVELHGQTWLWPTGDGSYNKGKELNPVIGGSKMKELQLRGCVGKPLVMRKHNYS